METKRIVYATPEGGVAVVIPAPNCGLTIEEIMAKDVPAGLTGEICEVTDIPSDRTFRNGWVKGNGKAVDFDITKCKEITHGKRRVLRENQLAPLDKEINISIANQAKVGQIEAQRQAIRNANASIQTEIDACTTVEGLKAIIDREGM